MSKKLFISNIDFEVTEQSLEDLFKEFGKTTSVVIALDKESGRSKGFAFVEMDSESAANEAIKALNNKNINGRSIRVALDRGKDAASSRPNRKYGDSSFAKNGPDFLPPIQRVPLFRKPKREDPFSTDPKAKVDYRDVATLSQYVTDTGKIQSRRNTGLPAFYQRKVAKAIKRAQGLGLMPYYR